MPVHTAFYPRANLVAESEASLDVAREGHAGLELQSGRFLGHPPEQIGFVGKEIGEHIRGRCGDGGIVRGIGGPCPEAAEPF